MTVTNRNSTLYSNVFVNKYIADARDVRGRMHAYPFEHTVVSGEVGGASALLQDTVNLTVLPALVRVVSLFVTSNDLWASAGVNGTFQIGDSGDDDRYMTATEAYSSGGSPLATEYTKQNMLPFSGQNYKTTADTIVVLIWKVANPVVGKIIKGCFLVIPAV